MTNLLAETRKDIERSGHTPEDVVYIGSVGENPHGCTWAEFERLADVEYDDGFGGAEVAQDLVVVFSDGSWLERGEYDGSEWWNFNRTPEIPANPAPIQQLVRGGKYWETLAAINASGHAS